MGINLGLAYGAGAAGGALERLLAARAAQKQQAIVNAQEQQKITQTGENQRMQRQLQEEQIRGMIATRVGDQGLKDATAASQERARVGTEAGNLANAIPPDTEMSGSDPGVATMRAGGLGALLTPKGITPGEPPPSLAAPRSPTQPRMNVRGLPGTFQNSPALNDPRQQAFIKEASQKQLADAEDTRLKQAAIDQREVAAATKPEALKRVESRDPVTGKPIIRYLPDTELRGKTFEAPLTAVTQNRFDSAKTVNDVGNQLIEKLQDPVYRKALGPVMGRYSKIQDFIGNPPPEYAELAGAIESYALANMGVHGMRSAQGAQQIVKLLQQPHTPESLIAAIKGLQTFSAQFVANQMPADGSAVPAATPTAANTPLEEWIRDATGKLVRKP